MIVNNSLQLFFRIRLVKLVRLFSLFYYVNKLIANQVSLAEVISISQYFYASKHKLVVVLTLLIYFDTSLLELLFENLRTPE